MTQFRMTCPDCGAIVVTDHPKILVWELCPSCRRHIWDTADTLMAEICSTRPEDIRGRIVHQTN